MLMDVVLLGKRSLLHCLMAAVAGAVGQTRVGLGSEA